MAASVIVLNQAEQFWDEVDIKGFISLLMRGCIEIIKVDESATICSADPKNEYLKDLMDVKGSEKLFIRDPQNQFIVKIRLPLIVKLVNGWIGYKFKKDSVKYSDNAVFDRDNNTCQYWHYDENGNRYKKKLAAQQRTIDHVYPRSRGGETNFENCVCACVECNTKKKRNRTPKEAGLELIRTPKPPHIKKGDLVIMKFNFNPKKRSHVALLELYYGSIEKAGITNAYT